MSALKIPSELNSDLRHILGRPNFVCGPIARRLRELGYECKEKAEDEQALVIHTMLIYYDLYKENWMHEFNKMLRNELTPG